ncbi:MBL fold metallo-hydrolase [Desulfofundulus sp.]|uniref:MBL fold metallo-hydrolase n=1 Tax=Desulfofundulus sp. TaxID=2282750 RepID=UPI003C73D107
MKIQWLGHACFLLTTESNTRIITDPFDETIGYPLPRIPADIVTVSHQHFDHNAVGTVPGNPRVVQDAGEHILGNIKITGYHSYHDKKQGAQRGKNIIFVVETEGLRVCHVGDLGHLPDQGLMEALGRIDVLMIPVGGYFTIDAGEAAELVRQLSPIYVLPMHYKTPYINLPIAPVTDFLKMFPAFDEKELLVVNRYNLPRQTTVVKLSLHVK